MKKTLTFLILYFCICISGKSQNRFEDGTYFSPILFIESIKYKFYADTFETYKACDIGCLTTIGLYNIVGNKIYFYPIDPDSLKKSEINYTKGPENKDEQYAKSFNEFVFKVKFKDDLNSKVKFIVWFRDSTDEAIVTIISNGDSLVFCNFNIPQIDKIYLSATDMSHEEIALNFDKQFIGEHIFNISLANDYKHFIQEDNYTLDLINRTEKGFSIIALGDTIELRQEKYATADFMNSWMNRINKSDFEIQIEEEFKREAEEFEKK